MGDLIKIPNAGQEFLRSGTVRVIRFYNESRHEGFVSFSQGLALCGTLLFCSRFQGMPAGSRINSFLYASDGASFSHMLSREYDKWIPDRADCDGNPTDTREREEIEGKSYLARIPLIQSAEGAG